MTSSLAELWSTGRISWAYSAAPQSPVVIPSSTTSVASLTAHQHTRRCLKLVVNDRYWETPYHGWNRPATTWVTSWISQIVWDIGHSLLLTHGLLPTTGQHGGCSYEPPTQHSSERVSDMSCKQSEDVTDGDWQWWWVCQDVIMWWIRNVIRMRLTVRLAVLTQYRNVTDGHSDRQTDRQTDIFWQHSPRYAWE